MGRRILPTFVTTVLERLPFSELIVGMEVVTDPKETYGYESIERTRISPVIKYSRTSFTKGPTFLTPVSYPHLTHPTK